MENNEILLCECGSCKHQIIFNWYESDCGFVYMETHLCKQNFWRRLLYALRYIFGYQCKYGAFEEIVLRKSDVGKLKNIIQYLEKTKD